MSLRHVLVICGLVWVLTACGSKHGTGGADSAGSCAASGMTCVGGPDCCSGICEGGLCGGGQCAAAGSACMANTDCCTTSCVGQKCSATQCVADGAACSQDGECCGGLCGTNHTCTPLNATCKTDGNTCSGAGDCCSKFCNPSGHCGQSSYCTQSGDACSSDNQCCGGICTIAAGATLGTCAQPVVGATNCSAGVDGTVCDGCGGCCSRLCEVYAPTGVKICQPAEGCRVDGDICRTDTDCCGGPGTGLPGEGHVTCEKAHPTDKVGLCRNPMACNPEGDICHYQNYQTCGNSSARNDCCGGLGGNPSAVCKLDPLGIPRCYGLGTMCRQTGETCSNSLDCCTAKAGACTQTSDCCAGATCVFTAGQTYGSCGAAGSCPQEGQACSTTSPCCPGSGSCLVTASGAACAAGQATGCTCIIPIF
jgi:hypothetical protein